MNIKRNWSILAVAIFGLALMGCKRYDEGPGISFRFKETRVAGFWHFEKFEIRGKIEGKDSVQDVVALGLVNNDQSYIELTKGGVYEIVNEVPGNFGAESGVWHMGQGWAGKDYMEVDKNDRLIQYWVIKMTNDHLKYTYEDRHPETGDMVTYEVWLVPKIL